MALAPKGLLYNPATSKFEPSYETEDNPDLFLEIDKYVAPVVKSELKEVGVNVSVLAVDNRVLTGGLPLYGELFVLRPN